MAQPQISRQIREARSPADCVESIEPWTAGEVPRCRDSYRGRRPERFAVDSGTYKHPALRGCYVADLFSGSGCIGRQIRQQGFNAREWDFRNGESGNLIDQIVLNRFLRDIQKGSVIGIVMDSPSKTPSNIRSQIAQVVDNISVTAKRFNVPTVLINPIDSDIFELPSFRERTGCDFLTADSCTLGTPWRQTFTVAIIFRSLSP